MKFIDYKEWQPKYAAYAKWNEDKFKDERREQAIRELVSEANEISDIVTKCRRKEHHIPRARVLDELGDTFWGLVGVMNEFDISLKELMESNYNKLTARNEPEETEKNS